jgi:hypothetical protein
VIEKYTHSVLQDWVMELPLREQGVLLTCIRGCDLTPKLPLDSTERQLVGFLRYCIMNPADLREVDIKGAFFQSSPPVHWKPSELGHYPLHWFIHVMHAYEVIAYRNKVPQIVTYATYVYEKMARSLHLNLETREQMVVRLSEDRIELGEVVS